VSDHHGLGAASRADRAEATLGTSVLGGVEVSTESFRRSQRGVLVARALLFALGFVVAAVGGLAWVMLSIGAVAHHFLFRTRQVLLATGDGLAVVTSTRNSCRLERAWPRGVPAKLYLTAGDPVADLSIDEWTARVSGIDLQSAEETIRAAGGEPVRSVRRPRR
jgi:hypothetical protein